MEFIARHPVIKLLVVLLIVAIIAFAGFLLWLNFPAKGTDLQGYVPVTGDKYAVILTGDDYGIYYLSYLGTGTDRFDEEGKKIEEILKSQYDYEEVYLEKTKESFLSRMNSLDLKPGDQLNVILFAHGGQLRDGSDFIIWVSFDELLTATELNNSLNKFEDIRLFIFVSSCGSGDIIKKITSVNRIILTSGVEQKINTGIPTFNFVKALDNKSADYDGDGKVDVAELFNFMKIGIEFDYDNLYRRRAGSDVIQIDDNADGRSTNIKLPSGSEGYLAMETYF